MDKISPVDLPVITDAKKQPEFQPVAVKSVKKEAYPDLTGPLNKNLAREVIARLPDFGDHNVVRYLTNDYIQTKTTISGENGKKIQRKTVVMEESARFTWDLCLVFDRGIGQNQNYMIPYNYGKYTATRIDPDIILQKRGKKDSQQILYETWCNYEISSILSLLKKAGLRTFVYDGFSPKEPGDDWTNDMARLYVLVGATEERLQTEAVRTQMELLMDIDGAIELGKFLRFPLAIHCENYYGDNIDKLKFSNLYCPYPQAILAELKAVGTDASYEHSKKQFTREKREWFTWLQSNLDDESKTYDDESQKWVQKSEHLIVTPTVIPVSDSAKVQVDGFCKSLGDKGTVYLFYQCERWGCPVCTKENDTDLNGETMESLHDKMQTNLKAIKEYGYTVVDETKEKTDGDAEENEAKKKKDDIDTYKAKIAQFLTKTVVWQCEWKELLVKDNKRRKKKGGKGIMEKIKMKYENQFETKVEGLVTQLTNKDGLCYIEADEKSNGDDGEVINEFVKWQDIYEIADLDSVPEIKAEKKDDKPRMNRRKSLVDQQLSKIKGQEKKRIMLYENLHKKWNIPCRESELDGTFNAEWAFHFGTRFTVTQRHKLTRSIIEASVASEGGAGLPIRSYVNNDKHPLEGFFPLHHYRVLGELHKKMQGSCVLFGLESGLQSPLKAMRDYFGEQVGFYFLFISFYSKWLLLPAFLGFIIAILQYGPFATMASGQVAAEADATPDEKAALAATGATAAGIAVFIVMWSTAFIDFWKRKMSVQALKWGMLNFKKKETDRPEFQGQWVRSNVMGEFTKEVPQLKIPGLGTINKQTISRLISMSGILVFAGVIATVIIGLILFRGFIFITQRQIDGSEEEVFAGRTGLMFVPPVMNAISILLLDKLYGMFAAKLTDWENCRTDTEYENSFITKSFIFKFLNSYNSLIYLSVFRRLDKVVYYCRDSSYANLGLLVNTDVRECLLELYKCWMNNLDAYPPTATVADIPTFFLTTDGNGKFDPNLKMALADLARDSPDCRPMDTNVCKNGTNGMPVLIDKSGYDQWIKFKNAPRYSGNCMNDVRDGLLAILFIKIVLQNLIEYLQITCKNKKRAVAEVTEALSNMESDAVSNPIISRAEEEMQKEQYENFQLDPKLKYMKAGGTLLDYDELVIQFGYVVLFVAAFPFAPALALVNNFVEIRLDSHKLTKMTRQPHPYGARDIGAWIKTLEFLSWVAIFTNVFVVVFQSNIIYSGNAYAERVKFFIFFEHTLLMIKVLVEYLIPDFPKETREHMDRQTWIHDLYVGQHAAE